MKETAAKILIIEDEMLIGANISLQLSKLGYEVIYVGSFYVIIQLQQKIPKKNWY